MVWLGHSSKLLKMKRLRLNRLGSQTRIQVLGCCLALLLPGCSGPGESPTEVAQSATRTLLATGVSTLANSSPTRVSTQTTVATATDEAPACFGRPGSVNGYQPTGMLAFVNPVGDHAYLRDVVTAEVITLAAASSTRLSVSPDGKLLAFFDRHGGAGSKLQIVDATGNAVRSVALESEWEGIEKGWLNEHQIIISLAPQPDSMLERILLLDPQSGEKTVISSDLPNYPNIDSVGPVVPSGLDFRPDPTGTFVVYPDLDSRRYRGVELITQRTLFTIPTYNSFAHPVIWSHGSHTFAVVQAISREGAIPGEFGPPEELVVFSESAHESLRTHLADRYRDYYILGYAWSPNDRFIALWVAIASSSTVDPARTAHLLILDIGANSMQEYCVVDDQADGRSSLIWSPDSEYLVVRGLAANHLQRSMVVGLTTGEVRELPEPDMPTGWMLPGP